MRPVLVAAASLLAACALAGCSPSEHLDSVSAKPAVVVARDPNASAPYEWADQTYIAHAMGVVNGIVGTNSLEAFSQSYDNGVRIFEVDLILTSDQHLVARHDWNPSRYETFRQDVADIDAAMTLEEFRATKIMQTLTPLTLEDVVRLARTHPDIWIVTDTKTKDPDEVSVGLAQIGAAIGDDEDLASRFIIQIYNEEMYERVRAEGSFDVIYTLYDMDGSFERAVEFAKSNGIRVVTIPKGWVNGRRLTALRDAGIHVAVNTVNEESYAAGLRKNGVKLIYTDSLKP